MDALIKELERLGYEPSRSYAEPHGLVTLQQFEIEVGPYAGKVVDLAFAGKDFPDTPPAGIHVRPLLQPTGKKNINNSPLGEDWQYWSRRLPDWSSERSGKHIMTYVRKVLLDLES